MLEKYAREPRTTPRSKPISTKVTLQEYEDFRNHVEALGLTVSEAIRLLVIEELAEQKPKTDQWAAKEDQGKPKENMKPTATSPRKYLSKFKVDNKLPCPICRKWISTKKFSTMHARKHASLSSVDFLRAHEKEALAMVRELS